MGHLTGEAQPPLGRSLDVRPRPLRASSAAAVVPVGERRHAVVVGGGPAGALMALYLARHGGFRVSVFESLPDALMPEAGDERPRSYNVVLNARAVVALRAADVDIDDIVAAGDCLKLEGVCRHKPGALAKVTASESTGFRNCYSIGRSTLARTLLDTALRRYPDVVTVHTGHRLTSLHTGYRVANFAALDGKEVTTLYDLLIGADGVNSVVRQELVKQHPKEFTVRQTEDFMGFKTFVVPDVTALPGAVPSWAQCFHIWQTREGDVLCPPATNGRLTCTCLLENKNWPRRMRDAHDTAEYLQQNYPTVFPEGKPPTALARELAAKRVMRLTSTYCSRLSLGAVALVGDAGHSMWAALGQGTNCALESCRVLSECLSEGLRVTPSSADTEPEDPIARALAKYNDERWADVTACVTLSERGFGNSKSRSVRPSFILQIMITMLLNRLFPRVFPPVALFDMSKSDVRYGAIMKASEAEKTRARIVLAALCCAAVGLLLRFVV